VQRRELLLGVVLKALFQACLRPSSLTLQSKWRINSLRMFNPSGVRT
jgi:hypothetical protein